MLSNTARIGAQFLPVVLLLTVLAIAFLKNFQDGVTNTNATDGGNNITISRGTHHHTRDVKSQNATKYSILPKRIYSVIGLESSGTQFVSGIIRNALNLPMYREGSQSYNVRHPSGLRMERAEVQVQHFSLPWGANCKIVEDVPVVDVVLPSQCNRYQNRQARSVKECREMEAETWGIIPIGTQFHYPARYQLDIVSHKEWYDSHGVDQFFIIVVRDEDASSLARRGHCPNEELRLEEEKVGTDIIVDAINRYILKDGEKKVTRDNYQFWVAESYNKVENYLDNANNSSRRLQASMLPAGENVVLVSYESLVKLGQTYIKILYAALGIKSNYAPDIKNGNSKYIQSPRKKSRNRTRPNAISTTQYKPTAVETNQDTNDGRRETIGPRKVNAYAVRRQDSEQEYDGKRKRIHSNMINSNSLRFQNVDKVQINKPNTGRRKNIEE